MTDSDWDDDEDGPVWFSPYAWPRWARIRVEKEAPASERWIWTRCATSGTNAENLASPSTTSKTVACEERKRDA